MKERKNGRYVLVTEQAQLTLFSFCISVGPLKCAVTCPEVLV